MKQYLTRFACLLLCAALLCPTTLASAQSYTGDILVAVNTNLSDENLTNGSFSSSLQPGILQSRKSAAPDELPANTVNVHVDPETGGKLIQVEPERKALVPIREAADEGAILQAAAKNHAIGDTVVTDSAYGSGSVTMSCVYIGTYCTVWTCTSDPEGIRISTEPAKVLAAEFDAHCQEMVNSFGDWLDVDGDKKLAIFCYDIGNTYANFTGETYYDVYTAGCFVSQDMIGSDGRINGLNFGANNYTCGMDTIHMDTFPTMGNSKKKPFGGMDGAYSTLFHEMQHMINFSYRVRPGSYDLYDQLYLPTYLNEAFSGAAEHLICGADACLGRVQHYNYSYQDGAPLTYWEGSLDNYANSYLFSQYLRTRYGQLTGTDGSTLFKAVLSSTTRTADTLSFIADLLETTPQTLVEDFWKAIYLKEKTGPYGFAGEEWSKQLQPSVYDIGLSQGNIYNGGAMYFALDGNTVTPKDPVSLSFHPLKRGDSVSVSITDKSTAAITVRSSQPGQVILALYSPTGQFLGCYPKPVYGLASAQSITIDGIKQDLTQCTWTAVVLNNSYLPICTAETSQ